MENHQHKKFEFPEGFLWGTSTAAHQIEGNNTNSDWWHWEKSHKRRKFLEKKGVDINNYLSQNACNSYNRYKEDFSLSQQLGHNAHRLSIEWARIEPEEGKLDEKELKHYEDVLKSAKSHGLKLFVTLHHFTNPVWFAKLGGFEKKENVLYFVRYAEIVAKKLGHLVDFWITINEPEATVRSYTFGDWPPQRKNVFLTFKVVNNLLRAHREIYKRFKKYGDQPISMAFHMVDLEPASWFSSLITCHLLRFVSYYALRRSVDYCDFIGVNYYLYFKVGTLGRILEHPSKKEANFFGFPIKPKGLGSILKYASKFKKPIYITENGINDKEDKWRAQFIWKHLYYAHQAIGKGIDLRGYLHWSLIDNFEWSEGFVPKFGLIEVDRENNFERKIRESALEYSKICKNNYIEY